MATVDEINAAAVAQKAAEEARMAHESAMEATRIKMQALQIAENMLRENRRLAPAGSDPITAEAVKAYAETLESYVAAG